MTTRRIRSELADWRLRDKGLSQHEAAERLGCSPAAVSRMVRGHHRGPPELLERFVSLVLEMPLDLVAPYAPDPDAEEAEPT